MDKKKKVSEVKPPPQSAGTAAPIPGIFAGQIRVIGPAPEVVRIIEQVLLVNSAILQQNRIILTAVINPTLLMSPEKPK